MITTRVGRHAVPRAALLILVMLGFTALLVIVELKWGPLHRLDLGWAKSLNRTEVADPDQAQWWRAVSDVLSPTVLRVLSALVAAALWLKGQRSVAIFVVVSMAGAAALESVVKVLVGRARPVFPHPVAHAAGASFPSGHAMTSFVAFGLLVLLVAPRRRTAAIVLGIVAVALVGFSRLALGVHYLSDVLAGWLLGAAWLIATDWFFRVRMSTRSPATNR
jgi:undecaprenyl-diphosphatase